MKPGDYYIDDYYEPETIVIQVTDVRDADGNDCIVVYTSDPNRIPKGSLVSRTLDDEDLIPVAMITIDNKVILINL
jgi:hypothetical protein